MLRFARILTVSLPVLFWTGPLHAAPEADAPAPIVVAARGDAGLAPLRRPCGFTPAGVRRCTADGRDCIATATYFADVCRLIETTARANALDAGFLARLIWKESLFDAAAVSPTGAQGIAQFMPDTAALRGLADPFNPAEALHAAARYLADLRESFGNLGLAAVAYNGGEARLAAFIGSGGGLPRETRDYVEAITGFSAETWRDAPPESASYALDPAQPFRPACIAQAERRRVPELRPPLAPWGIIVASNRDRDGAARQVARLQNRHASVMSGERIDYTRDRSPGLPGRMHFAQVGRDTREAADLFCSRLRADGGDCMVLRN